MEPLDVKNLTKGMVVGGTLCIRALLTGSKDLIFQNTNNDFNIPILLVGKNSHQYDVVLGIISYDFHRNCWIN